MREPEDKPHHKVIYINSGEMSDILGIPQRDRKNDATTVVRIG
jgi:hypothetical protein